MTNTLIPVIGHPTGVQLFARRYVHTLISDVPFGRGSFALMAAGWQASTKVAGAFVHPGHRNMTASFRGRWSLTSSFLWNRNIAGAQALAMQLFGSVKEEFISPMALVVPLALPNDLRPKGVQNRRGARVVPAVGEPADIQYVERLRVEFRACYHKLGTQLGLYGEATLHREMVGSGGHPRSLRYPSDGRYAQHQRASRPDVFWSIGDALLRWVARRNLQLVRQFRGDLPVVAELMLLPRSGDIGFRARMPTPSGINKFVAFPMPPYVEPIASPALARAALATVDARMTGT